MCILPLLCKCGPARQRPHKAVLKCVKRCLESSGAWVDEEREAPKFAKRDVDGKIAEARMDLVGAYPGMSCNFDIDVTLRAAHAGRYRAAARDALQPLQLAEEEKHERYGDGVMPVAVSPYGRVGEETVRHLRTLARYATTWGKPEYRHKKPGQVAGRWRMAIERVAIWASVDVQLLALGGEGGSSGARRAYAGESARQAAERRDGGGGSGAEDLPRGRRHPRQRGRSEGSNARDGGGEAGEGGGALAGLGGA